MMLKSAPHLGTCSQVSFFGPWHGHGLQSARVLQDTVPTRRSRLVPVIFFGWASFNMNTPLCLEILELRIVMSYSNVCLIRQSSLRNYLRYLKVFRIILIVRYVVSKVIYGNWLFRQGFF
jgi:hypothetical protein